MMKEKLKKINHNNIFWISWHSNPYNDFLFNEISEVYKLDVCYIKEVLNSHPWKKKESVKFEYFELSSIRDIIIAFQKSISPYSLRVIAGWNHPIMILMIIYLAIRKNKFTIWSDTPNTTKKRNYLKESLRKIWLKYIFNRAEKILVTGSVGVNKMIQIGAPRHKLINFPFVTDLKYFSPASISHSFKKNITFLSSGRLLNNHKGFDIAIKAFSLLRNHYPEYNFVYLIAGKGEDEETLLQLIEEEKLENYIKLLGWIEKDELISFYRSGDIFIHPSYFDPYPNVVLEAMSAGLPVLGSSSAGSVIDRVEEGVNGYIFEEGKVNQLNDKIVQIFKNISKLGKMKLAARMTAESWPISYNLQQLSNIIREIKD